MAAEFCCFIDPDHTVVPRILKFGMYVLWGIIIQHCYLIQSKQPESEPYLPVLYATSYNISRIVCSSAHSELSQELPLSDFICLFLFNGCQIRFLRLLLKPILFLLFLNIRFLVTTKLENNNAKWTKSVTNWAYRSESPKPDFKVFFHDCEKDERWRIWVFKLTLHLGELSAPFERSKISQRQCDLVLKSHKSLMKVYPR